MTDRVRVLVLMVYIPPPQIAGGAQPSYAEAYSKILAAFRSSPLTSASSVILLVAPDVDALCAARMLSDLFNQDDVIHRTIPISGFSELESVREELLKYAEVCKLAQLPSFIEILPTQLHTLILLNIGGLLELASPDWFGSFNEKLNVHVIDSLRPLNLENLFMADEQGERIILWDDGGAQKLQEEAKSWEALKVSVATLIVIVALTSES